MSSPKPSSPPRAKKPLSSKSTSTAKRIPLNRARVFQAAVKLADMSGIDALNMRDLATELEVVPMALYKHVANKEELLDEMVDVVVREIEPLQPGAEWKISMRQQILSARRALLRHPWAPQVFETRTHASPIVLDYMNSLVGIFRSGGFSIDLTHHAMHALGSRMWGFIQEVFPTESQPAEPEALAAMFAQFSIRYPHIIEMAMAQQHPDGTSLIAGCDDQFEFEFALDLFLEGVERMKERGWTSAQPRTKTLTPLESVARDKKQKR